MSKQQEPGHAMNIAHFELLLGVCKNFGAAYNPAPARLAIPGLVKTLGDAKTQMQEEQTIKNQLDDCINARVAVFKDLAGLSTRVINAAAASGADALKMADIKGFNRKIQGLRAQKIPHPVPQASGEAIQNTPRTISVSQLSFDNRISHFSNLIEALTTTPEYAPNETELSVTGLRNKLQQMKEANSRYIVAHVDWIGKAARRNALLYDPGLGLNAVAMDVKNTSKRLSE